MFHCMRFLTALELSLCLGHNPFKNAVSFLASTHLERASPMEGGVGLPRLKHLGCFIRLPL